MIKLYKEREHTVQEMCRMMGISKPTLYQYSGLGRPVPLTGVFALSIGVFGVRQGS
ncbi:helix-turn-helix domain-containing protein [Legionella geestiana]|nr:helix-turn-helix domain-containing protein [Legionella geestiana]